MTQMPRLRRFLKRRKFGISDATLSVSREPLARHFMLSKCANPDCSRRFRYISEGKLFVIEAASPSPLDRRRLKKTGLARRVEYRWLCDECSQYLTIAFQPGRGSITVPLRSRLSVADAPHTSLSKSVDAGSLRGPS